MTGRYGIVHGRFQPFHNGHLAYVMKALKESTNLVIGITNPDPTQIKYEDVDPRRHMPKYNPFTFFERLLMIKRTLEDANIDMSRINIVPLPIHNIELWKFYLPANGIYYMILTSEWAHKKLERMRTFGLEVQIIGKQRIGGVEGANIRKCIVNKQDWECFVPKAVARVILDINGVERIRMLYGLVSGDNELLQ